MQAHVWCEMVRPVPDNESFQLDEFLPYQLSVVANRISRALARAYSDRFGLSIPEWRVIAVLAENPEVSAQTVGHLTAMDKVAVSRAVTALVNAGHVLRVSDDGDKRKSVLSLSHEGRRVYEQIVPIAAAHAEDALSSLSTGEQDTLRALMTALLADTNRLVP